MSNVAPFNHHTTPQRSPANTDQQRAIAEVQAAMMIARANPRNEIAAIDRIKNACMRIGLAESAVYTYSRGGSDITGPSIRLAEAIAQSWGNIQFGIRELDNSHGESVVQAFAWDVETNTRREVAFNVPHKRYTKLGSKTLEDPRDIYEAVANQGARRLRACLLAIIPGDIVESAVAQCEETMRSKADTSPDALAKLVKAFSEFKVTKENLEKRIQRKMDAVTPAQIVSLRKIYASLRDGMSVASDWFEIETIAPPPPPTAKQPPKEPKEPEPEALSRLDELRVEGTDAAASGGDSLNEWYDALSPEDQILATAIKDSLKPMAEEVDLRNSRG